MSYNPYKIVRMFEEEIIKNRNPGKVLFKKDESFIIICGSGFLSVKDFFDETGNKIEIAIFRIRFN